MVSIRLKVRVLTLFPLVAALCFFLLQIPILGTTKADRILTQSSAASDVTAMSVDDWQDLTDQLYY